MIRLSDILYKAPLISTSGDTHIEIKEMAFDSRKVTKGFLFVAVKGTQSDGHDFIDQAISQGASAIVYEKDELILEGITTIKVENSAKALGIIASNFYKNPSSSMKVVGVTGTNGKTTTVTLLFDLFRNLGYNVGLLSTVENKINEEIIPSTHTTADPIQLNALMSRMVKAGCTHCFMEVSSHALAQHRVEGIEFAGGVFTNISHDHLDYHKNFDEYIRAKKLLFDGLSSKAFALVNIDDKRGHVMLQNTRATKETYALRLLSDYKAKIISNTFQGLEIQINTHEVWFKLIGKFNAYNILAAYGTASSFGEDSDEVLTVLSNLSTAPGRFEVITEQGSTTGIVDYAHTPDALENVLLTIKEIRTGNEQLITVIGCGGNRDKAKRPLMANIACKYSDMVILTSDNPRDEDPAEIIREMEAGVSPAYFKKKLSITDRGEAIKTACSLAAKNDIILVAGKGHETYQEIKGVKHEFDDRKVLKEMLKLMQN